MKPRTEGRRRSRPASLSRCTGRRPETGPHNRSRQNVPCDQPHGVALAPAGASRVRHPRAARLQHAAVGWPPLPVAPRTSIPGPPPPPHGRAHQDPDHPPEGRAAGGARGRRFKSRRPDQRLRRSEAVLSYMGGRPFPCPGCWWSRGGRTPALGLVGGGVEAGRGEGGEPVEGFAEVLDVVAWWSQLFQPGPTVVSLLGLGEGVVDGIDGFAGGLLDEVAVEVRGGRQGGLPQRLGDHGERDARCDGDGGGEVAQVVVSDPEDAASSDSRWSRSSTRCGPSGRPLGRQKTSPANGSLGSPRVRAAERALRRRAVATWGEMATQFRLERVFGVVMTRRLLSTAERMQRM